MDTALVTTVVNSRLVFGVVAVIGMAMCSGGIGKAARLGLWMHPITVAGYVLGALALLLAVQGVLRLHLVPLNGGQALLAILWIIVLKVALARLYGA